MLASHHYFLQTAWRCCRGMTLGIVGCGDQFSGNALETAMKKGADGAFFVILPVLSGLALFCELIACGVRW